MVDAGGTAHPQGNLGYAAVIVGDALHVTLDRRILGIDPRQDWSGHLVRAWTSAVKTVRIDVSGLSMLPSTVIGALIQLADGYRRKGAAEVILVGCSDRVRRTLEMMRITGMFTFA
jgi:ABC-type transporter Mla MlaB component